MSVYFAQIGIDGPIKIGESDDPARRLRQLQTNVPWTLRLLSVTDEHGTAEIYHQFSSARMKGEWFYPTRELIAFIESHHKLKLPNPYSWRRARRRAGSNLVLLRRIVDLCADHEPVGAVSVEAS